MRVKQRLYWTNTVILPCNSTASHQLCYLLVFGVNRINAESKCDVLVLGTTAKFTNSQRAFVV